MKMKKFILLLLVSTLLSAAYAENPGSFEVSLTPIVTYSVTISTPANGIEFSAVEPGHTYVCNSTVTVRNSGNVSADWKIVGAPLDTWQLGAAPAPDTVRLLGAFNTSLATSEQFDVVNDTITTTEGNMDETHYSIDQSGNNVAKNAARILSIRLDSPTDSSVDITQKFRIEIRAYPSSTF